MSGMDMADVFVEPGLTARGVRATHAPTGIAVEAYASPVESENKKEALEELRRLVEITTNAERNNHNVN